MSKHSFEWVSSLVKVQAGIEVRTDEKRTDAGEKAWRSEESAYEEVRYLPTQNVKNRPSTMSADG
jgi:hypothetical protein